MPKKKTAQTTKSNKKSSKKTTSSTLENTKKTSKSSKKSTSKTTSKAKANSNELNSLKKETKKVEKDLDKTKKSWATVFILILIFNIGLLFYAIHTNYVLQKQYSEIINSSSKKTRMKAYKEVNSKSTQLAGTSWKLNKLAGTELEKNQLVSLVFENSYKFTGFNGCNNYFGTYKTVGNKISFGNIGSSMMACIPENMQLAEKYEAILKDANSYIVSNGTLKLLSDNGTVLAEFKAVDDKTLSNTKWNVLYVNNQNGGVTSLIKDTTITLNFDSDEKITGNAGCNDYSGKYSYDKDNYSINIGPLASTKKMCSKPEGVMQQEHNFFTALEKSKKYKIEPGGKLTLRDANGSTQITAKMSVE